MSKLWFVRTRKFAEEDSTSSGDTQVGRQARRTFAKIIIKGLVLQRSCK